VGGILLRRFTLRIEASKRPEISLSEIAARGGKVEVICFRNRGFGEFSRHREIRVFFQMFSGHCSLF
jgi:hypothetical protein